MVLDDEFFKVLGNSEFRPCVDITTFQEKCQELSDHITPSKTIEISKIAPSAPAHLRDIGSFLSFKSLDSKTFVDCSLLMK